MGRQQIKQVIPSGEQWIEPRHGILKHQAHGGATVLAQVLGLEVAGIPARHLQHTVPGAALGQQAQNGPCQGAFATAGRPHQGKTIPRLQPQRHVPQRRLTLIRVANGQLVQMEKGHRLQDQRTFWLARRQAGRKR